jgi:phosphoglycerate dehydrogenase-like enzyme
MMRILVDVAPDEASLAALKAQPDVEVEIIPFAESARELPTTLIEYVEFLFCSFPPLNFDDMRRIRWIQIASSGYSQLFHCKLTQRGVRATNARGCFDVPIAEWNVAMMVNLLRNLPQLARNQQARVWDRSAQFQRELRGAVAGIWGYGGIGRETARLAKTMGMRVHVFSRNGVTPSPDVYRIEGTGDADGILPDRVFLSGSEQEFLRGLDFLILAMPLTRNTEGIIGEKELAALPKSAYLLNPARGPLIEEQALLRALAGNWISGAALDTHYQYPMPADHPIWAFPNVIFTPHISGSSLNPMFQQRLWDIFSRNVARYSGGGKLLNELTADQLRGE